ncbi:AraC family transcriptional regulato [Halomicronema hongdechloris C2206]|uniref:AraC family transcriptional regulato n=1 Tax=Halomicronema hongdechloris C2206 TaxID=1641165 RepID=A0A1Z3HNB4_9CYAN|nr:AraC family transcriptional regulator [Halomicronema hongdechloris]ASC71779.1 AraC family transcriptional regulato [Halomicronema hongdechloris C2206]
MTITLSQADYWELLQESVSDCFSEDTLNWVCAFSSALGQGVRRDLSLRDGIDLVIEDSCFQDDLVMQHCDRIHPVEYTFEQISLAGRRQQRYHFYGSGLAPGDPWRIPSCDRILRINVHIDPEVLQRWLGDTPQALNLLLRLPDEKFYEHSGAPTAAMQMTVQQILNCPFQGLTQRLYLESKVWELMVLLIETLQSGNDAPQSAYRLTPDDVERIHYASNLLHRRLLNPPSLIELARAIGINDHKLKVGFRQVFGTTVFGYLHQQRLERSRQLLESGDMNVTQAAHAVGFANRGHFAAAFRRKFGVNPGVYLRRRRG